MAKMRKAMNLMTMNVHQLENEAVVAATLANRIKNNRQPNANNNKELNSDVYPKWVEAQSSNSLNKKKRIKPNSKNMSVLENHMEEEEKKINCQLLSAHTNVRVCVSFLTFNFVCFTETYNCSFL